MGVLCEHPRKEAFVRGLAFFLAALFLAPSASLSAQQQAPVEVGTRIRVEHDCTRGWRDNWARCQKEYGTLSALSTHILTVMVDGEAAERGFPLDSVTRLDVSRGRKSNTIKGALWGLLGGGAAGAMTGALCDWGPFVDCGSARMIGTGAGIGGATGLVIGAGLGAMIISERWEEVPLDRLRVSFAKHREGFALGLSVSF